MTQTKSNTLVFKSGDVDIPFKKYVLSNGLKLIVHEDFKAPIAAVNVWYHVGSKNEPEGKSGFAHLFEHLMFNGSENFNTDYFQALEAIGATDLNGTTNNDRTNYFQNVPVGALDQVLWLESDRMGHLTGAIDQGKLDEQRGVVLNEKKQGDSQPYSKEDDLFNESMFPKGHPYSWSVIGSEKDVEGATVQDVHDWFKKYYGAANAIVVIAGAIHADDAYQRVKKYFGHIPSGPTISRHEINIPIRMSDTRQEYEDHVPESKITIAWNIPQWGTREAAFFDLIAPMLGSDKNSRLYKALIYENQLANSITAYNYSREICGNFLIECKIKNGVSIEEVENKIHSILNEFIENGPTENELIRVKSQYFSSFIKGIERIGGFGGKSDVLAESEIFGNNPEFYKTYNDFIEKANAHDLKSVANTWLKTGSHTIIAKPFPSYSTSEVLADRKIMPSLNETPPSAFPAISQTILNNGLELYLAHRKESPTVIISLMMNGGYASDHLAGKPGLASIAMNMLDEGTIHLNALQISERLALLGASIRSVADLDKCYLILECLKPSLDQSLELFAEILLHPSFPAADFERIKGLQLAGIQREKMNPAQMALRVMPKFLFGDQHPYSLPLSGSGNESSLVEITLEDIKEFYDQWIHPKNALISAVGDLDLMTLKSKLENLLAPWNGSHTNEVQLPEVEQINKKTIYLLHKPEVNQSVIIAGYVIPPYGAVDEIAKEPLINILGGDFTSRINLNLREDKHWTYGAGTFIRDAKGHRPFITFTQVQIDKTRESMEEIIKEFDMIKHNKPIAPDEFEKTNNNQVMSLPGIWETNAAVSGSLTNLLKYELPKNYWATYSDKVRGLTLEEVQSLTNDLIDSEKLQWFIVSNKDIVLPELKKLPADQILLVDSDGNVLERL